MPESTPTCLGTLVDTFGEECFFGTCTEVRTVGMWISLVGEDDTKEGEAVFPLCEEHLADYLRHFCFGRRFARGADGEPLTHSESA